MNRTRPRSSGSSGDSLRYRQLWWRND